MSTNTKRLRSPVGFAVWLGLAGWILVTFLAAAIGSQFGPTQWYESLVRPRVAPPNWVFAPVWTVLYLSMAVAAWRVWKRSGFKGAKLALLIYLVQLGLNSVWSWLFFGLHRLDLALLEILVLLVAIAVTMVAFARHDRWAYKLLMPYAAWVAFAALLNFEFWRLN